MSETLEAHDRITDTVISYRPEKPKSKQKAKSPPPGLTFERKPLLLDLFCCAGGAGVGYVRAGFDVVGVDIVDRPNYPLPFIKADALTLDPKFIAMFDAVHASPRRASRIRTLRSATAMRTNGRAWLSRYTNC